MKKLLTFFEKKASAVQPTATRNSAQRPAPPASAQTKLQDNGNVRTTHLWRTPQRQNGQTRGGAAADRVVLCTAFSLFVATTNTRVPRSTTTLLTHIDSGGQTRSAFFYASIFMLYFFMAACTHNSPLSLSLSYASES